jgi:CMP/dCMP kinase
MVNFFRGRGQPQTAQNTKQREPTRLLPETMWAASEQMPSGNPPEDTVVVTISRQFGSGGASVARMVSEASGLHYIDHEIIDEVARRLGVDVQQAAMQNEHTMGLAGHILEALQASNPFMANYSTLLGQASALAQSKEFAYFQLTQRVILEQATQGNAVIVGRGSQFLLHNAPRTLHIYIFAPLPYRIETIMKRYDLDHSHAQRMIEQYDYEHDNYLRHYYGNDGQQPSLYHLLINTGLFSLELASDLIRQSLPVVKEIHS